MPSRLASLPTASKSKSGMNAGKCCFRTSRARSSPGPGICHSRIAIIGRLSFRALGELVAYIETVAGGSGMATLGLPASAGVPAIGGHWQDIVGYDDSVGLFLVQGSWSSQIGRAHV